MIQEEVFSETVGSLERPIGILDDQEQKNQFDYLLEESRNQAILKQAYLCRSSLEITFAIIKTKFRGDFHRKEELLKKDISRYFLDKVKLDIFSDYFTSKIEPDYSNPETQTIGMALILYGVDFMDTARVGNTFHTPEFDARPFIHCITWLNDSNCRVIFHSPQQAQKALEHLVLNIQQYKIKAEEDGSMQLPKEWFQLKPYEIYGIPRRIFARYVTFSQLQLTRTQAPSRYVIFQNAQRGLQLHLLSKYNAFQEYQKITNLIQFQNYKKNVFKRLNSGNHKGSHRLSNDLLDQPLKHYFKEKKFIDLEKEPEDRSKAKAIAPRPQQNQERENQERKQIDRKNVISNQMQEIHQDNEAEKEVEKGIEAKGKNVVAEQSYIMIDQSEEPKVQVEIDPQRIQDKHPQQIQSQQTSTNPAQQIQQMPSCHQPQQTQQGLVQQQVQSIQYSPQTHEPTHKILTQVNNIIKPVSIPTTEKIVSAPQPTNLVHAPQPTQPSTVAPKHTPIASTNLPSLSKPPQSQATKQPKPLVSKALPAPNKGKVLPTSMTSNYEPDSY